jgi:hypothetical protein
MANGISTSRFLSNMNIRMPDLNRELRNIRSLQGLIPSALEQREQQMFEAQQKLRDKEEETKLFLQYEKTLPYLTDKIKFAEQMNQTEIVDSLSQRFDLDKISSEEDLLQEMYNANDAKELVSLYNQIRPDSYYSDTALQLANQRVKFFGTIVPVEDTINYDLNRNTYTSNLREMQLLEQQIANTTNPEMNPQLDLGTKNNPIPISYNDAVERLNTLNSQQADLIQNINMHENNIKNPFQYALNKFTPQIQSGAGMLPSESEDEPMIGDEVLGPIMEDIEGLGLDENYVRTLERLDISELEADALGENQAEQLDPIVSTLENISGLLEPSSDFTERRYTSEEREQLKSSVDTLIDDLEDLGVDVDENKTLQILDSLSIDARGNVRSDGEIISETRESDVNKLRELQDKLKRVQARTQVNPDINLFRQRLIQSRMQPVEERLGTGAYLDEILQLIGE